MKVLRYTTTLIFSLLLLLTVYTKISAIEVINRESLNMEESLSAQSEIYSAPQKIYIAQLGGFNSSLSNNPSEWVKYLYYYSVTRLKLNDIPYNYLIDSSGNIYEGARGGIGVNPSLEGGDNVVLIGVMDSSTKLSPRASSSLRDFVEELSYMYGIKEGNWDFVDLKIKQQEGSLSYLVANKSNGALISSLRTTLEEVKWSSSEHLEYKASIESVVYEKDVVIGEKLQVKVTVKNENNFAWFGEPNYIYVSTKDSKESIHAINSVWESFSKPTTLKDKIVKPNSTAEITFELQAKSKPGKYTESFLLMKSSDVVFEESSFSVDFNIVKGDNKIVQIVSPQYGFVNIRECRWYSCEKVEVANEGDVFITTKKEEGWYEILYGDKQRGWVYQKYANEI